MSYGDESDLVQTLNIPLVVSFFFFLPPLTTLDKYDEKPVF